jgi:NodT family efflux transporter outer membrane factor (OMF) lipoprotein
MRQNLKGSRGRRLAHSLLVGMLCIATLSGCAHVPGGRLTYWWHNDCKVGPNHSPPPAPVASNWIEYADPRIRSEEQDLSNWWSVFNDPTLDYLIRTAYQQNLTLRVAGTRILEARAELGIARGELFPQTQNVFADYQRIKLSQNVANPPAVAWFSNWDVGATATWELDFWGRFRRAIEAAEAELDASVEDFDDVLVILLSDVAAAYVEYRTFEQRLVYARNNVEIQRRSVTLADDKFQGGATTERDVHQAKQVLAETEALIPFLEVGRRQAANRLCVLMGMPPQSLDNLLAGNTGIPVAPRDVIVGVPADLLRRRPDVRRAERQVAAQSARIGIAVSDLFPHISLTGTIGLEAEHFDDLFDTPESLFGNIGPGIRWDVLNYGRLLNGIRVQDARFQGLAFAYQDRVLNAGREVEDAMVVFLRSQEQAQALDASVQAATRTVEITRDQYTEGEVDFTPVFLFESTLTEQQDELAVAQGDIAQGLIGIYRALGGGWQIRLENCNLAGGDRELVPSPVPQIELLPEPQADADEIKLDPLFTHDESEQPSADESSRQTSANDAETSQNAIAAR